MADMREQQTQHHETVSDVLSDMDLIIEQEYSERQALSVQEHMADFRARIARALAAQPAPGRLDSGIVARFQMLNGKSRAAELSGAESIELASLRTALRESVDLQDLAHDLFCANPAPDAAAVPEGWREYLQYVGASIEAQGDSRLIIKDGQEFRRRLHLMLSAAPQPAAVKESLTVAQPEAKAGADDDGSQDDAVWNLIRIAERCGAKRDSDDNSTWWTLDVNAFYALEEVLRERVSDAMYRESEPKPAKGGAVKARIDEIEYAISCNRMTAAQVFTQMRQLTAPAGSGEAVAWQCRPRKPRGHWFEIGKSAYDGHDADIFPSDEFEKRALYAGPVADAELRIVEAIAKQWDGCEHDAPGETIDIGEAIRSAARRLAGATN